MTTFFRTGFALATLALLLPLAACSGAGPGETDDLDGCLATDRGTIAIGVTNSAGEPLTISAIEVVEGSGIEVIDRFIALDEHARDTAVVFVSGGRDQFGGVDLDRAAIEPGAAAFIGIEVERTGPAEGLVAGLLVTADGTERPVPVTLVLGGPCD